MPVVMAFRISRLTPTVGLDDRGIMELSFAGLWIFSCVLTNIAAQFWTGWDLFRLFWWNLLLWPLLSLYVLFGAFQGITIPMTIPISQHLLVVCTRYLV